MRQPIRFGIAFRRGCLQGETLCLRSGDTTLGRSAGNCITLPDIRVSRSHVRLRVGGATLTLEDRDSRTGTWLNGRRIRRTARLRPGDRIAFGNQEIEVVAWPADGRAANPADADADARGASIRRNGPRPRGGKRPPLMPPSDARSLAVASAAIAGILAAMACITAGRRIAEPQQPPHFGLVPAGWFVESQFVDIAENGATNEIVLVLHPPIKSP